MQDLLTTSQNHNYHVHQESVVPTLSLLQVLYLAKAHIRVFLMVQAFHAASAKKLLVSSLLLCAYDTKNVTFFRKSFISS